MSSLFPSPRRIVTGHNHQGDSIVVADSPIPCVPIANNQANFAVLWETREFPVNNDVFNDPTAKVTESLANKDGVVLRVVDIPGNTVTMYHRTESLDFGILFQGELTWFVSHHLFPSRPGYLTY